MTSEPLYLDAVGREWLTQCGPHDVGLPMACTCPTGDFRSIIYRLVEEIQHLRATSERFTDPSVVEAFAREIEAAKAVPGDPPCCFGPDRPCARHVAEHLVNAIRSERLVVLTVETADAIIRSIEAQPEAMTK